MALSTSLISYWPLNEASGSRNDLKGTNHLTPNNSPGQTTGLVYANAASFSEGNFSSLSITDNASLSTGDIDFTCAVWVKYDSAPGYNYAVCGKAVIDSSQDEWLIVKNSSNNFDFLVCDASGNYNSIDWTADTVTAGVWYLVIGRHDSVNNTIGISVNGGSFRTNSHTTGVRDSACPFYIGSFGGAFDLNGTLGPVTFWKQALSQTDASAFYNSGAGRTYASLVTSYALTSSRGSFTLSGQSANLVPRTHLYADRGSFALSSTVGLKVGRVLDADTGIYVRAGQDVVFERTVATPAPTTDVAARTVAGGNFREINISAEAIKLWGPRWRQAEKLYEFSSGRTFFQRVGDSGVYQAQPTAPPPGVEINNYRMSVETAELTLTGIDALSSTNTRRILPAANASVTLSGKAAGLKRGKKMAANVGSFIRSGQDVTLQYFSTAAGIVTTGNISTSSPNQITGLANPSIFNIGDDVIYEVPLDVSRGALGPGGSWPSESNTFANFSAMTAAYGSAPQGPVFACTTDSGYKVYWGINGQWLQMETLGEGYYYMGKRIPKALCGRITNKFGNTIVISPTNGSGARITYSGGRVYKDFCRVHQTALASGNLTLAAGDYPWGGAVRCSQSNRTVQGAGRTLTRIFSPRGCPSATLEFFGLGPNTRSNANVLDLTLEGNLGDDGFGGNWSDSPTQPVHTLSGNALTDFSYDQGGNFCGGVTAVNYYSDFTCTRVTTRNCFCFAFGISFGSNMWLHDCRYEQTGTDWDYLGWKVGWNDSNGGGSTNFTGESVSLCKGVESFKATNQTHTNMSLINFEVAHNSAGGYVYNGLTSNYTAGCIIDGAYPSRFDPCITVNSNIDHFSPLNQMGGTFRNLSITQFGYMGTATNESLKGIVINDNNQNVFIDGMYFQAPNYSNVGGLTYNTGACGVKSTALNYSSGTTPAGFVGTSIRNITTVGTTLNQEPQVSIYIFGGHINYGGHSVPAGEQIVFYGGL